MNGDIADWNFCLLFAALSAILGIIGIVSTDRFGDRWLSSGLFLQGVVLTFIAAGAYFRGTVDVQLGGLAIVGLLILQSLFGQSLFEQSQDSDHKPLEKNDVE